MSMQPTVYAGGYIENLKWMTDSSVKMKGYIANQDISFTNGIGSFDVSSYIGTGETLSSVVFAVPRVNNESSFQNIFVTGAIGNNTTKKITVMLKNSNGNTAFTGSQGINVLFFTIVP